ncbi:VOC family protein [bacterium]|nr:VOC family protein [bacterium]
MLTFDHIALSAATLEEGVERVETALGVKMAGGGKHALMGTHNRLLGMGDLYLEVIAIDPEAPQPGQARWFDLDRFAGPPRLTNWVARSDDLAADIAASPRGVGRPVALSRGDFFWRMAVPASGVLPFAGAYPALIQWLTPLHPTQLLPDVGVRLKKLVLHHPRPKMLRAAIALHDPRLHIVFGREKALTATFHTPHGDRSL